MMNVKPRPFNKCEATSHVFGSFLIRSEEASREKELGERLKNSDLSSNEFKFNIMRFGWIKGHF